MFYTNNGDIMRKEYHAPRVIDYGSIANNTFATPAVASRYGVAIQNTSPIGDGSYECNTTAGMYAGQGGKNYLVLQCDKFGEYSHS